MRAGASLRVAGVAETAWARTFSAAGFLPVPIDIEGLQAAMAGRYALERELGHGATASVYLARDLNVPKPVAIKVLNPDIALEVTTERFRREIRNTAPLTHPYILGLTDAGVAFDTQTGQEILYYVMPYAPGGSLREQIERGGRLPITQAVRIAWEVADALAYAHSQGVIHRDIKPGNILLGDEHVWVADFGVARKIEDERLTATGAEPGTPSYLPPEHHSSVGLDHRSDIYSLGCVLYEMLVGKPPFEGPTLESLAVQRLSGPAPAASKSRRLPKWLDTVVAKALAQKADDRYQTAIDFRDALRLRAPWIPVAWRSAAAVAAGGGVAWVTNGVMNGGRLTAADTLTYAVLPVAYADSAGAERLTAALHDELASWSGITVVDQQLVSEQADANASRLTTSEGLKAAERLRAGRYVSTRSAAFGDSIRLYAVLHDALQLGAPLRAHSVRLSAVLSNVDSAAAVVVDRLLFEDSASSGGTRSVPARRALGRGMTAVGEWALDAADSAFSSAVRADASYGRAHLWLAQVRMWSGAATPTWQSSAERAATHREHLTQVEQIASRALVAQGRADLRTACDAWHRVTRAAPDEFGGWFGLGSCLYADRAVVRDARSPSRWRFRSSYYAALRAFQRAYQLLPAIHRPLGRNGFASVHRLFLTGGGFVRTGFALPPDTLRFAARPSWDGDTLLFVPYDERDVRTVDPVQSHLRTGTAIRRLRLLFHEVALAWVAAYPDSPVALEALAASLEMLGDPACLDTLRRARSLATDPTTAFRIAAGDVWMQLKFSIPLDIASIRSAKRLADSLLRAVVIVPQGGGRLLGSLAALTGRADLAAAIGLRAAAEWRAPGPISRLAPRLLAYAALGGPEDSLRLLDQAVNTAIENLLVADERQRARDAWLARAATLAFPDVRLPTIERLAGTGDPLLDAQAALVRHDSAHVRTFLDELRVQRRFLSPEDVSMDGLYPEADLWVKLGRRDRASAWIDPALAALAATPPGVFFDPTRAGTLVRAMALRARVAEESGDPVTAARWARVVAVLWSDGDATTLATVRAMERIVRR